MKVMADKIKTLLPSKGKLGITVAISFAYSFMLFIYTPLDMFLHNPVDFVVGWRFLLPPLMLVFVISFIAIFVVLTLLHHRKILPGVVALALFGVMVIIARFALGLFSVAFFHVMGAIVVAIIAWILLLKVLKRQAFNVVVLLMGGVLLAAYIQTLFLNGDMVSIMGQQTGYGELTFENIRNILTWIVIIIAPLFLCLIFKPDNKPLKFDKAYVLSIVIIVGMQTVGLVSTAISTDLPEGYDQRPIYFSYDAAINFNDENNVLVFLLDTLDVRVIRDTFEAYPHLQGYLDGFTLYENHTAEHFGTVPSVVAMLTGHHAVAGQQGPELKEEAWAKHNFIDTLRENGFRANLYLCLISVFGNYNQIAHRSDNLGVANHVELNIQQLLFTTTRLSFARISPYLLKNTWLTNITPDFGRSFFNIEVEDETAVFIPMVGIHSDMRFHRYITHNEFTANSEESVFTFIFLNGPHAHGHIDDPYSNGFHFDEATGGLRQGGSRTQVTRAVFESLNYFFNRMKEIGVYDNTTIIITGDHGLREQIPDTVSLFIKPQGSTGPLVTDSVTELSLINFQATVMEAAGLAHECYLD